uniref:PUM-HD domain-containing protein n=1 Tax=Chromera velia CCMP2878 TaxID=1169474 RepID=A0A0G4GCG6_9ALVE
MMKKPLKKKFQKHGPKGGYAKETGGGGRGLEKEKEHSSKRQEEINQLVEYLKHVCARVEGDEFESQEERALAVSQVIAEVLERGLELAQNQRASRLLEKLLLVIAGGGEEDKVQGHGVGAIRDLLLTMAQRERAEALAADLYASHVMQKVLDAVPRLIAKNGTDSPEGKGLTRAVCKLWDCLLGESGWEDAYGKDGASKDGASEEKQGEEGETEEGDDIEIPDAPEFSPSRCAGMMCHAKASHVFRALINTAQTVRSGRQAEPTKSKATEPTPPMRPSKAFTSRLLDTVTAVSRYVEEDEGGDPSGIVLDTGGSPAVQALLRAAASVGGKKGMSGSSGGKGRKRTDRLIRLLLPCCTDEPPAAGKKESGGERAEEQMERFVRSPVGSRVVEAAIEVAGEEVAGQLAGFFRPRIRPFSLDGRANFVVQRILQTPSICGEEFLREMISRLDFSQLISQRREGVVWRLLEACRRTQSSHREAFKALTAAVGVTTSAQFPFLWRALLSLSPAEVQRAQEEEAEGKADGGERRGQADGRPKNIFIQPVGCSILEALLHFPAAAVQPLTSSLKGLTLERHKETLIRLAKHPQGCRVLEAAVAPGSPLPAATIGRLIRRLEGRLADLAMHPTGSFAVAAAHEAAEVEQKKRMALELLKLGEELKERNYALWRRCKLSTYLDDMNDWEKQQAKGSKAAVGLPLLSLLSSSFSLPPPSLSLSLPPSMDWQIRRMLKLSTYLDDMNDWEKQQAKGSKAARLFEDILGGSEKKAGKGKTKESGGSKGSGEDSDGDNEEEEDEEDEEESAGKQKNKKANGALKGSPNGTALKSPNKIPKMAPEEKQKKDKRKRQEEEEEEEEEEGEEEEEESNERMDLAMSLLAQPKKSDDTSNTKKRKVENESEGSKSGKESKKQKEILAKNDKSLSEVFGILQDGGKKKKKKKVKKVKESDDSDSEPEEKSGKPQGGKECRKFMFS